jgi:hypothetical protein
MMQFSLPLEIEQIDQGWSDQDWETPPEIARKMAGLVRFTETCLEPAAGRGAIAKHLPEGLTDCIELNPQRVLDGSAYHPKAHWINNNFLLLPPRPVYDVVITNPPFSLALEFIEHSLKWLGKGNPNARLLYLLPGDIFASQARCDAFEALDCHIHHRYRIRGRVGYIREGVVFDQRQVYDCVYDIRPGKQGATETVL